MAKASQTKFGNQVKGILRASALMSREEKELEQAFLEIFDNEDLQRLARRSNESFYNLFMSSNLLPASFDERYQHKKWIIGLVGSIMHERHIDQIVRKYGPKIKDELGFRCVEYGNRDHEATEVKPDDLLSRSVNSGNRVCFMDIMRMLSTEHIYASSKRYDISKHDIDKGDLVYVGEGLTAGNLRKLILDNWLEPLSQKIRAGS